MVAISFNPQFLDPLLRSDKQQTTRPQTERFKVGDIAHIYIGQRRRITEKPLRTPTQVGAAMIFQMIEDEGRYPRPECDASFGYSIDPYYAHFLGKVRITGANLFKPSRHKGHGGIMYREMWAKHDGFKDFASADDWFLSRYGDDWMQQIWTVIRWNSWLERYFEPENGGNQQ